MTIRTKSLLLLLLVILLVKCVISIEEAEPEIYLSPRNFNPHPYERGGRIRGRSGPVLFPPNPEDDAPRNNVKNNLVIVAREDNLNDHPVDKHPYAKVARKYRYRVGGRHHKLENSADPAAYQALAKHAVKVLTLPPQELKNTHVKSEVIINDPKKDYGFSYKVVDHLTGDDFSHTQSQNSKATNGEYRVKLPDGRVQIVSYTADKNGYKADVKYTENEVAPQNVQIQRIPVRELRPIAAPKEKTYDYYEDVNVQPRLPYQHNNVIFYATASPSVAPQYNFISPTPQPIYQPKNTNVYRQPIITQPKVQIITTNARDYSIGSYTPSSATPYYVKRIEDYQRKPNISPDIINSGTHGLISPSPTPAFVLTDQHGNIVASTITPLILSNSNYNHATPTTISPPVYTSGGYEGVFVTTAAPPLAPASAGTHYNGYLTNTGNFAYFKKQRNLIYTKKK